MNPDSLAVVQLAGSLLDQFAGLSPEARSALLGVAVSLVYQGWKWLVAPTTPWLSRLTPWWEAHRALLNRIIPPLVAFIVQLVGTHKLDLNLVVAMAGTMAGYGIRKGVSTGARKPRVADGA